MHSPYAVEARGLVKDFGSFRAVDGVDIAVPSGSIYGILGPNGAGKTTIIRMLLGIIDPDAGERMLLGAKKPLKMVRQVQNFGPVQHPSDDLLVKIRRVIAKAQLRENRIG